MLWMLLAGRYRTIVLQQGHQSVQTTDCKDWGMHHMDVFHPIQIINNYLLFVADTIRKHNFTFSCIKKIF